MNPSTVLRVRDLDPAALRDMLARYALQMRDVPDAEAIPGSYWGDEEAGLIGDALYVRGDTPVHSALHEACHYICMDAARRARLHTDAAGDYLEENGVCYLQTLLAEHLADMGRERMFRDMDAWGYSFRLGSARAWFERDAQDARDWLRGQGLIDELGRPTWRLRE